MITVIVVNYNTRDLLRDCLATAVNAGAAEVMVVDNASSDGSAAMVRRDYPTVTLLANQANSGFGAAANQAIFASRTPYVLLLNSDVLLNPQTVPALTAYLECRPQAAVAGPRLLNADGSLQPSAFPFPTPAALLWQATSLGRLAAVRPALRERLRERYLIGWNHDQNRVVPWVMGAVLAIRRDVFTAVGGFDPTFYMFSEEVDLCYRLQKFGWQVHYTPSATAVHLGGASTNQQRHRMEVQRYRSTELFYRRHYSVPAAIALRLLTGYSMARNILRDAVRLRLSRQRQTRERLAEDLGIWRRVLRRGY
jgi:GT2 family glycosyltransferase